MAIAFGANLGTGASTTSSTTVTVTTTTAVPAGALVVVCVATDNLTATTPTYSAADNSGVGNSWVVARREGRNATAAAGIGGAVLFTIAQGAMSSGTVITVTLSGSVAQKAATAQYFTGVHPTLPDVGNAGANGSSTAPSTSRSIGSGNLAIGCVARETNATPSAYDTDTTNGTWSTAYGAISVSGGTATSRVGVASQYKVVSATGTQTYNQTLPASTDWAAIIAEFYPEPIVEGTASLSATGELSGTATVLATHTATASLSATGELSGTATVLATHTATASLSATASLTGSGVVVDSTTGTLTTASASLTAAGVVVDATTASLSASASLTSSATVVQGAVNGEAALSASAALSGAGVVVDSGGAALAASAALTAAGVVVVPASAVLASSASLAASATRSADADATATATAALVATALINDDAEATFDAVAELLAAGDVRPTIEVTITAGSVPYPPRERRNVVTRVTTSAKSVPYPPREVSDSGAVTVTVSAH